MQQYNITILDAHETREAQIICPKIVSKFDIQTRGRVVIQEFNNLLPGLGTFKATFINIDQ